MFGLDQVCVHVVLLEVGVATPSVSCLGFIITMEMIQCGPRDVDTSEQVHNPEINEMAESLDLP